MSFWDNVKKFAQPYAEDDYEDYDEDDYADDYDEPAEPRRSARRSTPAATPSSMPLMEDEEEEDSFGFTAAPAAPVSAAPSTGFNGHVMNVSSGNKQEVVLFHAKAFSHNFVSSPEPIGACSQMRSANFCSISPNL